MYGLGRAAFVLLALAIAGFAAWQAAIRWHPSVEEYPVQGVDVSEANGAIEWNAVAAAGADFAFAVATHGTSARDRRFEANWAGIEGAGMRRGAVLAFALCQPGPDQANAFNTVVPRDPAALPATIAIEDDPGCTKRPAPAALIEEVRRAAAMIETHTGKPVLLRVSRTIEADYDLSAKLPRPIWAVGNFLRPGYAARPWRMWRASDLRRIDGIEGPVNWDVAAK